MTDRTPQRLILEDAGLRPADLRNHLETLTGIRYDIRQIVQYVNTQPKTIAHHMALSHLREWAIRTARRRAQRQEQDEADNLTPNTSEGAQKS